MWELVVSKVCWDAQNWHALALLCHRAYPLCAWQAEIRTPTQIGPFDFCPLLWSSHAGRSTFAHVTQHSAISAAGMLKLMLPASRPCAALWVRWLMTLSWLSHHLERLSCFPPQANLAHHHHTHTHSLKGPRGCPSSQELLAEKNLPSPPLGDSSAWSQGKGGNKLNRQFSPTRSTTSHCALVALVTRALPTRI